MEKTGENKTSLSLVLLSLALLSWAVFFAHSLVLPKAQARPAGVLLQEGLYAEETEGDLEKAISLYEQVLEQYKDVERLAARATYQLGMCYLKKGENEKAAEYFQQVISNYSDQKILVKKADEQLKKVKPETKKSVFEQIDGQVIRFISEKYGETAGEAGQKNLYANSHIYYVDPNFTLYNGGMAFYYNWTGHTITGKTKLSGTSYPNQSLYDTTGQKLDTEIVPDEQRSNFYHIFWFPKEPLAAGESLYYGWSIDDTRKLSQMPGNGSHMLVMQNQFGSPVIETFFLVLPKELEISQSNPPTGSEELLNFDVYWWTTTVQQGENHVERVQLKEVPEIVGQWQSVDFVSSPDQFKFDQKQWKGELFLKEITFNLDGSSSGPWKWTNEWIHKTDEDAKAQYFIKRIEGQKYLFFPWLSGDVTIRGQKPKYYVLKAVATETVERKKSELDPEKTEAIRKAIEAAKLWLALVDSEEYSESWEEAAEFFKKAMPRKQWNNSLEIARKPLGKLISREVLSTTYTQQVPGAPDGEYVVITFKTSFENKQRAIETITPMLDKDARWRVSGYYIK